MGNGDVSVHTAVVGRGEVTYLWSCPEQREQRAESRERT